jgi:hypothetical protein
MVVAMKKERKMSHFTMYWDQELAQLVLDWRRKQPDVPPRNEAIRRLLLQALHQEQMQPGENDE